MSNSTPVVEGSVAIRAVRALAAACRSVYRRLAALADRIDVAAGDARMTPPDPADEERVRSVLASSRLVRAIDAAIDVPPRAWKSSALRARLEPIAREFRAQPAADRVRLVGAMLLVATATHVALVAAFGEAVGWPTWTAWSIFTALVCVPTFWSRGVVAAWANRSPWVRRVMGEQR